MERINTEGMELRVPKAEPGTDTRVSLMESMPTSKDCGSLQQLRVPNLERLEVKRGLFSPNCVLGPNVVSLSCSSEDESGMEFDAEDSSDHSEWSDSDDKEYEASDGDEEESRPSRAKKQKTTTSEGKMVRSYEECPEVSLQTKSRIQFLAQRSDLIARKARVTYPGRRKVGSRIYDSTWGKTCHWCRQKTVELHVECDKCPIRFCGACLLNRNGEVIELEVLVRWICPKCRGGCGNGCKNCCNCGPCRKLQGFGPTGQLINVARKAGFSNVHDYLVHQKTKESPDEIAFRKKGQLWTRDSGAQVKFSFGNREVKQDQEGNVKEVEDVEKEEEEADVDEEEEVEDVEEDEEMEEEEEEEDAKRKLAVTQSSIEVSRRNWLTRKFSAYQSTRNTSVFSGSQFTPRTPPVDAPFLENSAEDAGTEESSEDSGSQPSPFSCTTRSTPQSDFAKDLEVTLRRPFSTHQLKEMWEQANNRKTVMKTRQTRNRTIDVPCSYADGRSYLDHYPDLRTKLAKAMAPEEKLELLRGFFFWLQHSCREGAHRPWRDAQIVDDMGDCTEIEGPDCQIIRVLLAIDEDEENAPPEWEDKKPVVRVEAKKLHVPKEGVSTFPVKVKQEKED